MDRDLAPIKTLIIDDEPLACSLIQELLQDFTRFEVLGAYNDGFAATKAIHALKPDLIFLDIQMPRLSGFEMLELVENPPAVIFCTAYDEFALKAFDAHAIDYLLKPCTPVRFRAAIDKLLLSYKVSGSARVNPLKLSEELVQNCDRIVVKKGNNIVIIPASDIHFIEANDDTVTIHTATGSFLKNRTLSFFEKALDDQNFIRVHRSFIVRVAEITRLELYQKDSYLAILRSGMKIPVSRHGYTRLKAILGI